MHAKIFFCRHVLPVNNFGNRKLPERGAFKLGSRANHLAALNEARRGDSSSRNVSCDREIVSAEGDLKVENLSYLRRFRALFVHCPLGTSKHKRCKADRKFSSETGVVRNSQRFLAAAEEESLKTGVPHKHTRTRIGPLYPA